MEELNNILRKTKEASKYISVLSTELKNKAIINIANALILNKKEIIEANKLDINNAKNNGLTDAMINRLELNENKIIAIANDMKKISELEDPVGEIIESYKQEPIYYTFYTEPEKEPELVQETFKYKPLGVYGGKAYFYSTDSYSVCVLNEDKTFTELDASYGDNSLRVGDELYFNQRIIKSNT